jgi:hypothetical protein
MGTGGNTRLSGASLLPATAAMVAQNLAPVAWRIGWARARIRSIGEGVPGKNRPIEVRPRSCENGSSKADPEGGAPPPRLGPAGKATHRLWRGTPPYRRRCAASSAACSWIPSLQCVLIPNHKTTKRTSKESLVNLLVSMPDKLALLAAALYIAGEPGAASQEPTDTPGTVELPQETADTHAALRAMFRPPWRHSGTYQG